MWSKTVPATEAGPFSCTRHESPPIRFSRPLLATVRILSLLNSPHSRMSHKEIKLSSGSVRCSASQPGRLTPQARLPLHGFNICSQSTRACLIRHHCLMKSAVLSWSGEGDWIILSNTMVAKVTPNINTVFFLRDSLWLGASSLLAMLVEIFRTTLFCLGKFTQIQLVKGIYRETWLSAKLS